MVLTFVNKVYIDSGRLCKIYLCPGLVDTVLLLAQIPKTVNSKFTVCLRAWGAMVEVIKSRIRHAEVENGIYEYACLLCGMLFCVVSRVDPDSSTKVTRDGFLAYHNGCLGFAFAAICITFAWIYCH